MKKICLICLAIVLCVCLALALCGYSDIRKNEALKKAVSSNLISGLSASTKINTMPWAFPSTPMGPYSSISGFMGTVADGPQTNQRLVFFLGKVRKTGEWQVFAAMTWSKGKWTMIPVELPPQTK